MLSQSDLILHHKLEKGRFGLLSTVVFECPLDPNAQPTKLLTDCTIKSAEDAKDKGLSTGLKWNPGRGNRLLILHMIGSDGLIPEAEKIWIHTNRKVQSDDYHADIDAKIFFDWFKEVLPHLPPNAVVVMDNASFHNKHAPGTPTSNTKKADMTAWLIEQNVDFPLNALKADLWKIIQEHLKTSPEYSIDKMVKELRPDINIEKLPSYHCELNPIEMV